jgi:hypothetical protein
MLRCRCWLPPFPGWFQVNTDDAIKGVEERASCGGLVHDEHGNWICGFAQPLGNTSLTGFVAGQD